LEPCNECDQCVSITKGNNLDVIEIDAASNRGIDDIRNLKASVYLAPTGAKNKVYIIDEAHMLTIEAANAFLKTLEEPPDRVIFILATTNPEKLPVTVLSRLVRVNFTRAGARDIARQLARVAEGEGIKIDDEAIGMIARISDGSFRDAVKIFESLSFKTKDIKAEDVAAFWSGGAKADDFIEIARKKDPKMGIEFIEGLVRDGVSIKNFMDEVIAGGHRIIIEKGGQGVDDLVRFCELMIEARGQVSPVPQLPYELAVIKYCGGALDGEKKNREEKSESKGKDVTDLKTEKNSVSEWAMDDVLWTRILAGAREKNVSVEALLRGARPIGFDGKNLTLGVYYQFHKDKLGDEKNSRVLEDICREVFAVNDVRVELRLIEKPALNQNNSVSSADLTNDVDKDIIDAAKEIFG
jgi:DNA polymerase-3 subunit gamma/tau